MKNLILPICAILLLASSCKSTKNLFQRNDVQQNTYIEIDETMAPVPNDSKKQSYLYPSLDKTVKLPTNFDVTKTIADLQVFSSKIEYSCSYNGNDDAESRKAAVNYAISQALKINGNADVMIEPKFEVLTEDGRITSVRVSGYVANYCNFRTATKEDLKLLKEAKDNIQIISKVPVQEQEKEQEKK